MKVFADTLKQRHLRTRRRYWEGVYTQNGFHRVPMPCLETYNGEGEIVPFPPLKSIETPLLNLLPRMAASTTLVNWEQVDALLSNAEGSHA